MRHGIVFMCVFQVVLAACSPKQFSGERVARASVSTVSGDSTALHRWLDQAVRESMDQHMQTIVDFESVTVRETLSDPDPTGAQHVTGRSTTRARGCSVTSYGASYAREESKVEEEDSTAVSSAMGEAVTEEHEEIRGSVSGWMPWYVYVICLAGAVVIGIGLAIHGKKWWNSKH